MSEGGASSGNPLIDWAIPIILGSGAIAAAITAFADWLAKKREREIDLSKNKIENISESKVYYIQMARCFATIVSFFAREVEIENEDSPNKREKKTELQKISNLDEEQIETCFFVFCKLLYFNRTIFEKFGDLQLGNQCAENVLASFSRKAINTLSNGLTDSDLSKLNRLVNDKTAYHDFSAFMIPNNAEIYSKFKGNLAYIRHIDNEERVFWPLVCRCRCYSIVLNFEMTNTYRIWYKKLSFKKAFLTDRDRTFLREADPEYYQYLMLTDRNRILQFLTLKRSIL